MVEVSDANSKTASEAEEGKDYLIGHGPTSLHTECRSLVVRCLIVHALNSKLHVIQSSVVH